MVATHGRARASRPTSFELYDAIAPIQREWDELADRTGASPFVRPGWMAPWLASFGAGALRVLAIRRDGRLVAVAPTLQRRSATVSPTNFHTPVFDLLAEDGAAAQELVGRLLTASTRRVDLSFLPSSESAACTELIAQSGGRVTTHVVQRSPYVALDGTWSQYRAGLRRGFRRELDRCRRRLEERGEPSFECGDGRQRLAESLAAGFEVESSGWKGRAASAIASRPETRSFYEQISRWAAERGWLRLCVLRLDGRAIAFDLALEADGAFYVVKGGFVPAYREVAPGMLLTAWLLERAFADGLETYELLGDADPYKLRWTDRVRPRIRVQAFPASPAGHLSLIWWRQGRPLAKAMVLAARRARVPGR